MRPRPRGARLQQPRPSGVEAIAGLAGNGDLGDCVVGAGTVLDERSAQDVISAGARFVVSPTLNPAVLRLCRDKDVVCLPGALTPTELLAEQHAMTLTRLLAPLGLVPELLIGRLAAGEKTEIRARLRTGMSKIVVGTSVFANCSCPELPV